MESEVKHYDKFFGNCEVYWKIEDFCLVNCEENRKIQSSEFCVRGPESTTWKLIFIPNPSNTFCMRLYLERLNDSGPLIVFVNWSLTIGSLNEDFCYTEYRHHFEKLTKKRTDVHNLSDVLSVFQPFDCDTLIIRCHLIVQHVHRTVNLDEPSTLGLKHLSEDLRLLYQSDKNKDLVIEVGKTKILVHKAVFSRNDDLRKLISNSDINIVKFPYLNSVAVAKYVDYLYTGDLERILKYPSISMYKCLKIMDNNLFKRYFALEELKLHTKIKVEEFEHLWKIQNFSERKEKRLTSPPFKQTNLDTTWQMRIHLNGIDNINYLSVFVDIVEGKKPSNLCLEFAVEDCDGEIFYPSRILSFNGNYDLGVKEFVNKDYLRKTSLVVDDTLNLAFRVRTWDDGEYCSRIGSRMVSFITETEESSYGRLSRSLLNVYWAGINADILIRTGTEYFGAHKCILSARSPVLSDMIKDIKYLTLLTLNDITPYILKLFLEYIYSGVLCKLDHHTLTLLCKVAETYRISSLEKECLQALQNNIYSLADYSTT